ncbi:mannosyl-oligosaccharide glucosidase Ecym_1427 [Eremothecium cymbalariae DBVPG|uniref:Mannosyl-oligosaccharide glucosidase n=1 Tax=Eremothecium cymbalariae (strain CBS 270.75 / DBVPG 7215 / KCTC 17166 / NRRL Y-17582) TaxID=931890 RepID=G8JM84_ERECY|nr:hypothetical protein Ecym_1427 [Eremothecium cymbalariae DBVPG\
MPRYKLSLLLSIICFQFVLPAFCQTEFEEFDKFNNDSLLWGAYRANCYFGVRPRYVNEDAFIMGLMWMNSMNPAAADKLRHFVDMGDNMAKYGWELYDPRVGGKQVIIDKENNMNLTIYFVKSQDGQNWGFRVRGEALDPTSSLISGSIIYYMNQEGDRATNYLLSDKYGLDKAKQLHGMSAELGEYEVQIFTTKGHPYSLAEAITPDCDPSTTSHVSMTVPGEETWKAKEIFKMLILDSLKEHMVALREKLNPLLLPSALTVRNIHKFQPGNFHYIQKTFDLSKGPFEVDFIYNKVNSNERLEKLDHLIQPMMNKIRTNFEKRFQIRDEKTKQFGIQTLSNLLGGLSYFHGKQIVDRVSELDEESFETISLNHPEEEGPLSLFTFVPSRAFFPRGFYWDEGFHLLQVMEYDFDLAFEVLRSWVQLIEDDSGWIARELILGQEARSKVPEEFRTQNPNIANPPTLALAFSELLQKATSDGMYKSDFDQQYNDGLGGDQLRNNHELLIQYSERIYEKFLIHFEWFRKTQRGMVEEYLELSDINDDLVNVEEGYRWVGRTFTHCLPSGFDDYPRAIPPDIAELHVDALSWVGIMARSLKQAAQVLGKYSDAENFQVIEDNVIENLEYFHWSKEHKSYCDITINDEADVRKFVCHEGYVSLLPFALKLIPRNNQVRLKHMIKLMSDPEKIFSEFGLLSLSKQDKYYDTAEIYWRGPIWVNINYLCLDALRSYFGDKEANSIVDPTLLKQAKSLYRDLRKNLLTNIVEVWDKDGFCYEQYNHKDGHGQRVQHFTGWTSLAVNIAGIFPETI